MKRSEWGLVALAMFLLGTGLGMAYGALVFVFSSMLLLAYGLGLWVARMRKANPKAKP